MLYGWGVLEGWECIGNEREEKPHHYIILMIICSTIKFINELNSFMKKSIPTT